MKKVIFTLTLSFVAVFSYAQIGIGTTTPNSTLDVRGSMSTSYRAFTASTTASSTDNLLVFTGSSAATVTLPTAVGCDGRMYMIKNASTTGPTPVVTIATTSAQTIDAAGSWTLTSANETITLISNGANWNVSAQSLPGGSGVNWTQNGNSLASIRTIGTISNHSLPFITNNTEKMRLTNTGNLGIGTSTFNGANPEKLLVDAGTTTSVNAIVGKGSIDSYLQLNIQNNSAGTNSSSDVVATANNGSETTNYVDMGINGGNNTSGVMGVANDAYLYNIGQNMLIGTGTAAKSLVFMTGGTTQATNERMRIDGTGRVGIGTNAPTANLHVVNSGTTTHNIAQFLAPNLSASNATYLKLGKALSTGDQADIIYNWSGTNSASNYLGFGFFGKPIYMLINNAGNVGIGATTFNVTNPEKLLVDAGTTTSVNAIVGKGSIDSYLQLNIQNNSTGTSASSDVVATANNGSETTNYVDMGINGGSYSGGVMGAANDSYLYNMGQNFLIGTGSNNKALVFMTGGTSQVTNERARIDGSGNMGIGTTAPTQKLDVTGNFRLSGAFMPGNSAGTSGHFLQSNGAGTAPSWVDASTYLGTVAWMQGGNSLSAIQKLGTISNHDLPFITNNTEKMRLSSAGNLAVGASAFNGTNPEKLLVDAGTTTSVNAIVGKGSIDSYLQLNIQNNSAGTFASSDVVATANNGSETNNYIDMGVNGGNYTGGVMGTANDGYLYNMGQNLLIATGTAAKSVVFMTGGTSQATNERMRINGSGLVGIGNNNPTSTLSVTGSTAHSIVTKTASYTATASDYTIVCNNSGGITITLPAASGATGRVYVIKKISGALNNVTVDANASETIDGATTRLLTIQNESVMIQCDGTSWYIISKN